MSKGKKPATPFANLSQDTRTKLARWVADQLHDMEVDADSIAETEGPDFMPALRGMADYLFKPDALYVACRTWRDDHQVSYPEQITEMDSVNESLPGLAEDVCAVIGYVEVEDE